MHRLHYVRDCLKLHVVAQGDCGHAAMVDGFPPATWSDLAPPDCGAFFPLRPFIWPPKAPRGPLGPGDLTSPGPSLCNGFAAHQRSPRKPPASPCRRKGRRQDLPGAARRLDAGGRATFLSWSPTRGSSFRSFSARPKVTRLPMTDWADAPQTSRPFLTRTDPRIPGMRTITSPIGCCWGIWAAQMGCSFH